MTYPHLTLWDRFLSLFGVKTSFRWCLLICTMGRHSGTVSLEKCRNGTPICSGWFITVYAFPDEDAARACLAEIQPRMDDYNKKNGYWV